MIFTIGHVESYRIGFKQKGDNLLKLGKCIYQGRPYPGGAAFLTQQSASEFLSENGLSDYAVYGLLADWEADTEQLDGEPYRRLLKDACLINLQAITYA